MISGVLPGVLVMATLGMMLGFSTAPDRWAGLALALAVSVAGAFVPSLRVAPAIAITGCWITVAAISVFIYLPRLQTRALVCALSALAALVSQLAQAPGGSGFTHALPMLGLLSIAPTLFAIRTGFAIAPRVITSWILAVSLLAAILPFAVPHPGYVADHRE